MSMNEAKRPKVAIVGGGRSAGRTLKAQIDILEELQAYRAIGTVEECRDAVERMKSKKIVGLSRNEENDKVGNCPCCRRFLIKSRSVNGCIHCLQRIDWE